MQKIGHRLRRNMALIGVAVVASLWAAPSAALADAYPDDGSDSGAAIVPPVTVNGQELLLTPGVRVPLPGGFLEAGPEQPSAPDCTNALDVGFTIKDGNLIKGQGSWTKCDDSINRVQVLLWQSWGVTRSAVVTHNHNPASFGSVTDNIEFDCSGAGSREYYVQIQSWNASGQLTSSKNSNTLTASC